MFEAFTLTVNANHLFGLIFVVDHRDPDLPMIGVVGQEGKIRSVTPFAGGNTTTGAPISTPAAPTAKARSYWLLVVNVCVLLVLGLMWFIRAGKWSGVR